MNCKILFKKLRLPALALAVLALAAGPSLAAELAAVQGQWSPDGGATQIPMWGFIEVANAAAYTCPGSPVSTKPQIGTTLPSMVAVPSDAHRS